MTDAVHPDHLQPGHQVGPWRIAQVVGQGGSSRVFKVEREGRAYSLKMALRPLSGLPGDHPWEGEGRSVYRKLAREAAALFTYASHPNLLRVYAVDFWPGLDKGFPFLVTDFVDGDNWHEWRWRHPPDASELVDVFSEVVRTVGVLHARGVFHRDLKADNLLIRRVDGRPFLIDFGTARLPGTLTRTLGLPEGVLHLLPPELIAYTRTEAWKRDEPFQGGAAVDLYALGVLLYQALTDLQPFDPELPDEALLAAIATVPPTAPHLLNPLAPRALSDIALRLLEKKPEARYLSAEVLLQALEDAAGRERQSPAWKVPLFAVQEPPARASPEAEAPPPLARVAPETARPAEDPGRPRRARRGRRVLLVSLGVLGLALWLVRSTLLPSPEAPVPGSGHSAKGSPPMSTASPSASSGLLAAWLCALSGLGCAGSQVRPPVQEDCSPEAVWAMFEVLKLDPPGPLRANIDINQPADAMVPGLYQDGPVIGRVTRGEGLMPVETILHGRLWSGPDITEPRGMEGPGPAVIGRYTKAILPDGRTFPVCIVMGDTPGRLTRYPGTMPGNYTLPRDIPLTAVKRWP